MCPVHFLSLRSSLSPPPPFPSTNPAAILLFSGRGDLRETEEGVVEILRDDDASPADAFAIAAH
jgi:hypothetical protein